MKEPRPGAFPPPLSWIPIGVALLLVTVASVAAFVPQYGNHQILGLSSSNPGGNGPESSTSSGSAGSGGTQGRTDLSGLSQGGGGNAVASGRKGSGDCAHGKNAGGTDTGVTASTIRIATTDVTTGIGRGFLGQAVDGMKAGLNAVNRAGGICGRQVALDSVNDGWDGPTGSSYISGYINSGNVFALVGEPDSEGLDAAVRSGTIDRAGMPVVGTDGMLKSQYNDPWIWPVAASTVTNMHIVAQYAVQQLHARKVAIVYDNVYKFGAEGANALIAEIQRLSGGKTLGMDPSQQCAGGFCGVSPSAPDYSSPRTDINKYCANPQNSDGTAKAQCDVVVMLLEPGPMQAWMTGEEQCNCVWFNTIMGGEPLFDDGFADGCAQDCAGMVVWSGYKPDLQPFDAETPVYTFANALKAECNTCDAHNEFTEGAYLGTELFIAACQKVGSNLTRAALKNELDTDTFDLGLSLPLRFGDGLPHLANISMVAYRDNATGSFNGWSYLGTGFLKDPAPGLDLRGQ